MPPDDPADLLAELKLETFDDPLGRRIIETHIWAVRAGLRGADAYALFDGYCQRLVIDGAPLWRAHATMETLHPQWHGYGYTWRRDLNAIEPEQYVHGSVEGADFLASPLNALLSRAHKGEDNPSMRRRLEAGPEQRDFPILQEFFAAGATDYFAHLFKFGNADRSQGTGIIYSFSTDREGGFSDDDTTLMEATLPALSLAMKAHAGYGCWARISARTPAGACMPAQSCAVRSKLCARSSGTPTSAASPRSATPRLAQLSWTCSTTYSRF
jgi:adenylate cyclase